MKVKHLLIGLSTVICGGVFCTSAHAVTYSSDANINFTLNSKLDVQFYGDAEIKILNLSPGTSSDSNIIGVGIRTNSVAGYTLQASVGNSSNASTNMVHTNQTSTFASIATNASQASLTTENTWGYSTSLDLDTTSTYPDALESNITWSNFSGLPIYTDTPKTLNATDEPSNDVMRFKINAKASASQPAGDYTNVINFIVIANAPPITIADVAEYLQDLTPELCETVQAYDDEGAAILKDSRDNKEYWVAKHRDDHCWMDQNLALDLDKTKALSSDKTNLTTSWTPLTSTNEEAITNVEKALSYNPGDDLYWDGEAVSSGGTIQTHSTTDDSERHYHVGNYYTWAAAVAMDNTSTIGEGVTVKQSICPKNWQLPATNPADGATFDGLLTAYNLKGSPTNDKNLWVEPLYMTLTGNGGSSGASQNAAYHTNTSATSQGGMLFTTVLQPNSRYAPSINTSYPRFTGLSIRCVVSNPTTVAVVFNANGGTGTMSSQRVPIGVETELNPNQFTRSGYVFNGWNTAANGLGEGYGDQGKITTSTTKTLYAQWRVQDSSSSLTGAIDIQHAYEYTYTQHEKGMYEETTPGSGIYEWVDSWHGQQYKGEGRDVRFAMQDIGMLYNDNGTNKSVCDIITVIGDQYQAVDLRDNKLYYISKLQDGRCWMTQNLDLDLDSSKTLTHADTDLGWGTDTTTLSWQPSRSTIDGTNGDTYSSGSYYFIDANNNYSSWHYNSTAPESVDVGKWYWNGQYYESVTNNYTRNDTGSNPIKFKKNDRFVNNGDHGAIGNYYNWAAAVASNDVSSYSSASYENPAHAQNSICPAGWKLPTSTSTELSLGTDEFNNLLYYYGGIPNSEKDRNVVSSPLYFVRGGDVGENTNMYLVNNSGYYGQYWSDATSGIDNNAYYSQGFTHGSLYMSSFSTEGKNGTGRTIRCINRQ